MLTVIYSNQFKKDYKNIQNNPKDKQALMETITILCEEGCLPPKYKPHRLVGQYIEYMECHIKPDLLLIYRIYNDELTLYLLRVGSHSKLFKK